MNYKEQYRHPKWQEKRLLVLQANGFTCQECGEKEKELHVHHPFYLKDTSVWDYPTDILKCLCLICHERVHTLDNKIKKWLSELTYNEKLTAFKGIKTSVNSLVKDKPKSVLVDRAICGAGMSMPEMLEKLMGGGE